MKLLRLASNSRLRVVWVFGLAFALLLTTVASQLVHAADTSDGDTAVTMWAVIFNNPQNCNNGCGADDLATPGVNASVLYVTGQRVQSNGRAAFAGAFSKNSVMGTLFGPGLIDPATAEIHLIVRSHGRVIPDMLAGQISSVNGGCPPNTCTDLQFAAHLPGAAVSGVSTSVVQLFSNGSTVPGAQSVLRRTANGVFAIVITRL